MLEILSYLANAALLFSLAALLIFYIPSRRQKYFGIAGVIFLEAGLLLTLPKYFEEGIFFYPIIIIAALPIIYITVKRILTDNIHVKRLVNGAAVALLIYLPFAIIKPLGNWLIGTVVFWIQKVFDLIGFPYIMSDWNIFESVWKVPGYLYGYMDEIILGCTGITAIAIILGVIFLTSGSWKQKILLSLGTAVPVYIINIFRNVFVITTYFNQSMNWFPEWFADSVIPGFASFYWSHNVISEGAAFIVVIIIALLLFKKVPALVYEIRDIVNIYYNDLKALVNGKKV